MSTIRFGLTGLRGVAPEIREAVRACRSHFLFAAAFSVFVNLLLFAYPIYLWQVVGRVIASRSVETLIALATGVTIAVIFRGIFHWLGSRLLVRASTRIDRILAPRVVGALLERSGTRPADTGAQLLRDLDQARQFYAGRGATAATEAPWAGLFIGVLFLVEPVVGLVALGCMVVLTLLLIANALIIKRAIGEANRAAVRSYQFVEANLRSAEAIMPMGMLPGVVRRWLLARDRAMAAQAEASERSAGFGALISSARLMAQVVILGAGALRVTQAEAPIGLVIVGVLLFRYAMRPIEGIIAAWEAFQHSRDGIERLTSLLAQIPQREKGTRLPRPSGRLTCHNSVWLPPGAERAVIKGVTLTVEAGTSLGIFGPTGSGKTSLVRMLVGVHKPTSGHVRLDGADIWSWERDELGRHLGYLPQDVCIVAGTVADNIGRFGVFGDEDVVAAAQMAGAHPTILSLPRGYDTLIGEGGYPLSGGQRQLVALARAVVGSPSMVVLDEPNANLDGPGESALLTCIQSLKETGATVVMVSHRPNLVQGLDQLALLRDGTIVAAGPTSTVMQRIGRPMVIERGAAGAGEAAS